MVLLQEKYKKEIATSLKKDLELDNLMQVPRLSKIVLNIGIGSAATNPKELESALEELSIISGQKPVKTLARKSIAGFKLREGVAIGCMVTLRSQRMYAFLERLINVVLPRVRDFRGISPKGFDGRGNYNLSLKEQIVFPEIEVDKVDSYRGMNITMVSTAEKDDHARTLLRAFGMPFREN